MLLNTSFSQKPSKRRFTVFLSFLLVAFLGFYFSACKKDSVLIHSSLSVSREISVQDVKKWYKGSIPRNGQLAERSEQTKTPLGVIPIFPTAFKTTGEYSDSTYQGLLDYVITPIYMDGRIPLDRTQGAFMLFHRDASGDIRNNLVVFLADSTAYTDSTKVINSRTFTGRVILVDENDNIVSYEEVEEGYLKEKYVMSLPLTSTFIDSIQGFGGQLRTRNECPNPSTCYKFGKSFLGRVGDFFKKIGNGIVKIVTSKGGDDDRTGSANTTIGLFGNDGMGGSSGITWVPTSGNSNTITNNNTALSFCQQLQSGWEDDQLQAAIDGEIPLSNVGGYITQTQRTELEFRNKMRELLVNSSFSCDDINQMRDMRAFTEAAYSYYKLNNKSNQAANLIKSVLYHIKDNPTSRDAFNKYGDVFLTKYAKAGFSAAEFGQLIANSSLFQQVDAFLNKHSKRIGLNQRIQNIMNPNGFYLSTTEKIERLKNFIGISNGLETQLAQFAQENISSISSREDMNILMRIFGKVLGKKIGKVIPFIGTGLGAEAAWSAYRLGNYGEAAFELAGVVMDFLPMGIIFESGWTIVSVAYDVFKAYKPISKFIGFAGDSRTINALIDVLDDLNLWNNFSWLNNTDGIRVVGQNKILIFWDSLISKFPNKTLIQGSSNEIRYNIFSNVEIKMYLNATTPPNCPTIVFKQNSLEIKIRFCD